MSYFKSTLRLTLIILIILQLASNLSSQQRGFSEEDLIKNWKKWLKKFSVPKDAIELEEELSFPSENQIKNGIYLWKPVGMISLLNGNILVNDQKACQILMFDKQGNFTKKIGKKGQGPGEFSNPFCLSATSETIIVGDNGNMRIQFFDLKGNYIRSLRIFKAYMDIAVSKKELIYAFPLRTHSKSPLIDVLDTNGKLLNSFGEARFGGDKSNWQIPNMIKISVSDKDELFIAYESYPLVCKYSKDGELLAEYKIEHEVMKEKEKINLNRIKKGQLGPMTIIYSIFASKDGFYILQNFPRTEILKYDNNGRIQNYYYYEYENEYHDTYFKDFFVMERKSKKYFYLLKKVPENKVVILRPKIILSDKERR